MSIWWSATAGTHILMTPVEYPDVCRDHGGRWCWGGPLTDGRVVIRFHEGDMGHYVQGSHYGSAIFSARHDGTTQLAHPGG